jgi:hypothetical protein
MDKQMWDEIQRLNAEQEFTNTRKEIQAHRLWPRGRISDIAIETADAMENTQRNPMRATELLNYMYSKILSNMTTNPKSLQDAVGGMLSASIDVVCTRSGQDPAETYKHVYAIVKDVAADNMNYNTRERFASLPRHIMPAVNVAWCYERARIANNRR